MPSFKGNNGACPNLFISHDLRVVELMSHKMAVMYLGKIVEMGLTEHISQKSRHPYTQILWSSLVEQHNREAKDAGKKGGWGVFDFAGAHSGCRFAPRCPVYEAKGRPAMHGPCLRAPASQHRQGPPGGMPFPPLN